MQGNAFLQASLFQPYELNEEQVQSFGLVADFTKLTRAPLMILLNTLLDTCWAFWYSPYISISIKKTRLNLNWSSWQATFRVNMSVFLDCLNMFGKSEAAAAPVGLRMFYKGYGHPLELMLEESGVVTDCRLKTMESSGIGVDSRFRSHLNGAVRRFS